MDSPSVFLDELTEPVSVTVMEYAAVGTADWTAALAEAGPGWELTLTEVTRGGLFCRR